MAHYNHLCNLVKKFYVVSGPNRRAPVRVGVFEVLTHTVTPSLPPLAGFSTCPHMDFAQTGAFAHLDASLNPMGFTSFNLPQGEREKIDIL